MFVSGIIVSARIIGNDGFHIRAITRVRVSRIVGIIVVVSVTTTVTSVDWGRHRAIQSIRRRWITTKWDSGRMHCCFLVDVRRM